jgi:hypothetical protein
MLDCNFAVEPWIGCQANLGENPASSCSVRSTRDVCHGTVTEEDARFIPPRRRRSSRRDSRRRRDSCSLARG